MMGVFLSEGGCEHTDPTKWEGGPVSHWISNDVTKSQHVGRKQVSFAVHYLQKAFPASASLPPRLSSFLFSAYLGWLLGPLLSFSTGDRGSNIVGRQTWASACFHLLCEFWHIVLLLNFWGLYYLMLCYIVLYYNLLGVLMKVNEIMHVRFLAGFLAYCKHQEIIYIYCLCNLLELRDFCPSCLLPCHNSILFEMLLVAHFSQEFLSEESTLLNKQPFFFF